MDRSTDGIAGTAGGRGAAARRRGPRAAAGAVLAALLMGACAAPVETLPEAARAPLPRAPRVEVAERTAPVDADRAAANFIAVARRMEPKIEAECRARIQGQNRSCDYQIMVDDRLNEPPNAYQTLDSLGRPLIVFNVALIAMARNADEIAFVMGHEAAHHVAAHIPRSENQAMAGALILGTLATLGGADATGVRSAQDIGASVGARAYSQDFELEADRLGTIIAYHAGFDPLRGAQFFNRLGDPGDNFLGSHPGNARRLDVVKVTMQQLRAGAL